MNRTAQGLALSLFLGVALAASALPATARAEGAETSARAADLYRRATHLYASKRLDEAEPLYREAWELQQSYEIASNYGALELELGKPRLAAELLGRAVSQFPVRGRPEERAALEARHAEARKLLGALRMKVSAPGAEVLVDGRAVGRSPLPAEVLVEPGTHVIEARLAGNVDAHLSLAVPRGSTFTVNLPLAPPPAPRKLRAVPLLVGAATGVAALAVGGALVGVAEKKSGDADTLHASLAAAGQSCALASPQCSQLHAASSSADTFGNTGLALFGVAGAAAVGTLTYVLWPSLRPGSGRAPDVRASFGVSPTGAAALITGSF